MTLDVLFITILTLFEVSGSIVNDFISDSSPPPDGETLHRQMPSQLLHVPAWTCLCHTIWREKVLKIIQHRRIMMTSATKRCLYPTNGQFHITVLYHNQESGAWWADNNYFRDLWSEGERSGGRPLGPPVLVLVDRVQLPGEGGMTVRWALDYHILTPTLLLATACHSSFIPIRSLTSHQGQRGKTVDDVTGYISTDWLYEWINCYTKWKIVSVSVNID